MGKFNPQEHISNIKGKDYIEVKWRLVWFRADNPNGRIDTELLLTEPAIVFKATIYNNDGIVIGTGHGNAPTFNQGSGTWKGREIEKAETAAIGRALAVAGFGTQFAEEMDDDDYLADTPLDRQQSQPSNVTQMPSGGQSQTTAKSGFTEPTNLIATKMSNGKTPKPFMVIEGVTVWSREPFRKLKFSEETIDSLANVGMTKLETPIIVSWELDEKGYKVPMSIKRTDSPVVVDANGKILDYASGQ
jgi:hypothetical protein